MHFVLSILFPTSSTLSRLICSTRTVFYLKMESALKPPEIVRGITELDKKLFEKKIKVTCLNLTGIKMSAILPLVKKYLLKLDNLKPIQHNNEDITIWLNPQRIKEWSNFPAEVQNALQDLSVNKSNLITKEYLLKYENFTAEDMFRAVLPTDTEGMSSFTKVGHIVHVNLREHLLPYKNVIGEILFDKVPGCRSVVNKINMIDNTYRNFTMELLKGDNDMLTTVKENNCLFKFDFSTVYWNSRLCTEHERIVKKLKPDDVFFDVFAGVGPFSIPSAKKKSYVYANDLNPESFNWLNYNAKANKIDDKYFKSFNKDGRDFIKQDIKKRLPACLQNNQNVYITMNLPAMAVEFLDSFLGLYEDNSLPEFAIPPTIFVYCFAKGEDYISIARNLVTASFGFDATDKITDIFRVRTVSSQKEMMRVTIRLDRDILVGNVSSCKRKLESGLESKNKKYHVEGESFIIKMGKNKKKSNNVFKVVGAKSLKLKAKAKAVKTNLKNLNIKNKNKVTEIDKALVQLEDKVRQTIVPEKKSTVKNASKLPTVNNEKILGNTEKIQRNNGTLGQHASINKTDV
ncbi:hypothetical protein NQ314_011137 [Rhamnusium bicolor]|uniref:tRNA (guanine(37)-N1)-methyltransferase n=1 Tax=Rhamnusium bicolor TaxID=1586634 RepID=A0AAV8XKI5_9CUCU|nr:hypothetical protein NQ314_011137 [Rhamnusium bicolor]